MFKLQPLPYAANALEPWISEQTVRLHHGKHQAGYVDTLNSLLSERAVKQVLRSSRFDTAALELLITSLNPEGDDSAETAAYRNASQIWNHQFYWKSMAPRFGKSGPRGDMVDRVKHGFAMLNDYSKWLVEPAPWMWLVVDHDGDVSIKSIEGVDTPLVFGLAPLAVCDAWEHAYYWDYPANRSEYIKVFVDELLNWNFFSANMDRYLTRTN